MKLDVLADALDAALPGRAHRGRPLAPLTTYRLGGPAALLVEVGDGADVAALAEVLQRAGDVPLLFLGRGSNTVVSDEGWPGVVVHAGPGLARIEAGPAEGSVLAGAGTSMPQLANWAARRGLTGLEFLVSIPGSVGGGVRMNAGAHGSEIADHLTVARVLDLDARSLDEIAVADLGMGYRRSALAPAQFVIDARFSLEVAPSAAIRERMESFRRHRAATQPGAALNAGSVFKNPPGDFAGRLVEATGLKGFAVGGARVSEVHANFFVAAPGATAQDVFDLVHAVRTKVKAATGIELEPEVRFAGSFRAPAAAGAGS
ncbi:MAG: UDP-N-acetylmuramate dehydrogenase [Actinomycetota bacterium]|nr:UDP-N-acetylmuramate dehydrogenase [Actinomycetota bacterium]